jgi:hypothetical protein
MKKFYILSALMLQLCFFAQAQFVGVGTNTPDALFHVDAGPAIVNRGVLFTGSYNNLATMPNLGNGSRFMFYPGKAALRAGYVNSTEWDDVNVGRESIGLGSSSMASGYNSAAFGRSTTASGQVSTAFGTNTLASGSYSFALGSGTSATATLSFATGSNTLAAGQYSTAMGRDSRSMSWLSAALGQGTVAKGYASTVVGMYNDSILVSSQQSSTSTTPLFIVGNGSSDNDRSNAMVVQKNGNVGIGTNNPASSAILDISSTSQGLLVPRMSRTSRDAISSPATGLLIYQTNETPGFVYNAGSTITPNWVRMSRRLDTLVVDANAFFPAQSSVAYATSAWTVRYVPTDGSTSPLRAAITLPSGATVTTMRVYYVDESSTANLEVSLYENYLTIGSVSETSFAFNSSGFASGIRTGSVSGSYVVKADDYAYFLAVRPGAGSWNFQADIAIKAVMIIYEY